MVFTLPRDSIIISEKGIWRLYYSPSKDRYYLWRNGYVVLILSKYDIDCLRQVLTIVPDYREYEDSLQ